MIQTKHIDIPTLLRNAKILYESGYMFKMAIKRLARDCKVELDKYGDSVSQEAVKAVKEFSYWIHERV
ncbi:MAG: hypothetical protein NE330_00755 [Lentisphaeraceae bacterium]|nr:hypothetical protein [Lentisphaeraceae bacterium]